MTKYQVGVCWAVTKYRVGVGWAVTKYQVGVGWAVTKYRVGVGWANGSAIGLCWLGKVELSCGWGTPGLGFSGEISMGSVLGQFSSISICTGSSSKVPGAPCSISVMILGGLGFP